MLPPSEGPEKKPGIGEIAVRLGKLAHRHARERGLEVDVITFHSD